MFNFFLVKLQIILIINEYLMGNDWYPASVGDKIWRKSFEVYDTDSPIGEVWQLNFYYGH